LATGEQGSRPVTGSTFAVIVGAKGSSGGRAACERTENAYFRIWRYASHDGAVELKANAARLGSKDWPYPVIELYLGMRSLA